MNHRLLFLLGAFSLGAYAQSWSSFLDASRAINWNGIGFTIPTYTVACVTQPSLTTGSSAAAANTTSIQTALNSCDATHNVVNIPAGTYYVSNVVFGSQGKQVLRGAGPNSTTLVPTTSCESYGGICMVGSPDTYAGSSTFTPGSGTGQCLWTAGYAQGTTSITLNSCPGGAGPAVNQMIVLDQANDYSDNGGIFLCDSFTSTVNSSQPCTVNDGGSGNADGRQLNNVTHSQKQIVIVQSVSGSGTGPYTVTISPGVYFNNIGTHSVYSGTNGNYYPGAYFNGFVQYDGLENMTIDQGQTGNAVSIDIYNCYECWVRNVRSLNPERTHVLVYQSLNDIIRDSYFSQSQSHMEESYAVELEQSSETLIENNIFQQTTNPVMVGNTSGSVVGYNYAVDDLATGGTGGEGTVNTSGTAVTWVSGTPFQPTYGWTKIIINDVWYNIASVNSATSITLSSPAGTQTGAIYFVDGQFMYPPYYAHNAGNDMNLWEGNVWNGVSADDTWGSSNTGTFFRNLMAGWQTGKTVSTTPVVIRAFVRAMNLVGNIMGQAGYHNTYQTYATSTTGGVNGSSAATSIYSLGWNGNGGDGTCTTPPTCDALTYSTLMRWGNWDVVNAATQWNSTEASPAAVAYVNANFTSSYFSSLAHTLPASLYYSSTPSWWPSLKAWPPIGPDVSSGNLGTCSGGTYAGSQATSSSQCTGGTLSTAWASHANSIPAQDCYLTRMGGPPDGSGSVLSFDAHLCYPSARPPSPIQLTGIVR